MEENTKITFARNLNKLNFNTTLNIPVDSNANIKNILNINTFVFDNKIECGNGKAIISGKIGTKVLYIDTDNLTNTLLFNTNYSETYLDSSLTSETILNISSSTVTNNILSMEGNLKINCDVNLNLISYINLPLVCSIEQNDFLITKKSELKTNTISQIINTNFEHTLNHETTDNINKILCNNAYFSCEKVVSQNGYITVEGKFTSTIVYECKEDENLVIKQLKDVTALKYDVEISNLSVEDSLDLTFCVDQFNNDISTEIENATSVISIKHIVNVCGVALKPIVVDVVDDLFSTSNEVESTLSKREYTKQCQRSSISEIISNEITLNENETAIDDIVANLNITPEITNSYIKDNTLQIEGIVTSNLTYVDENKEIKTKELEVPFILNTKFPIESLGCVHNNISVVDYRLKVKRGTVVEIEYTVFINFNIYEQESREIVSSYSIGKTLDFSKFDFQIYIAKPNETMWELCKRIKITPEEIHKLNKNLPLIMEGGERVVIKR